MTKREEAAELLCWVISRNIGKDASECFGEDVFASIIDLIIAAVKEEEKNDPKA